MLLLDGGTARRWGWGRDGACTLPLWVTRADGRGATRYRRTGSAAPALDLLGVVRRTLLLVAGGRCRVVRRSAWFGVVPVTARPAVRLRASTLEPVVRRPPLATVALPVALVGVRRAITVDALRGSARVAGVVRRAPAETLDGT